MNEQERIEHVNRSVKARKLIVPQHLQDLPINCPNLQLLTDDTCALIDERYELFAAFIGEFGEAIGIQTSCWCVDELNDFTTNPFPNAIGVAYDGGWGNGGQIKFRKKLENVTLVDVWKACDKLIERSGDHHHVYIETLECVGQFITFQCGS